MVEGRVVWITGLSGAGKSSLAKDFATRLRANGDLVVCLDGDELREIVGETSDSIQSYGREERLALAMLYARFCKLLAQQGLTVVIATISLFREVHKWNRCNLPGYYEVYLNVPLEELRRRDPKRIYRRYETGRLANIAGLDLPVDEPEAADWVVNFGADYTVADISEELFRRLACTGSP